MVPFIWSGWYSQWNSYVPGFGVASASSVLPPSTSLSTARSLTVRLCSMLSSFLTTNWTFSPAFRLIVVGVYVVFLAVSVTVCAAAPPAVDPESLDEPDALDDPDLLDPHATSTAAARPSRANVNARTAR